MTFCGPLNVYQGDLPDAGDGGCCMGAAMYGPDRCTCWVEVFDLEQQPPQTGLDAGLKPTPCADCAYRPDSPERAGAEHVVGDTAMLDALVDRGEPFWCHQGIRRVVKLLHEPTGTEHVVPDELAVSYRPPIIAARPYKADGSPADLCSGWAARVLRRHTL